MFGWKLTLHLQPLNKIVIIGTTANAIRIELLECSKWSATVLLET